MSATIDVRDLRVGMFVHLDMGWMSHPFPLSNFRIHSAEQIRTIRGLGVERVRWSPEKSDAPGPEAVAGEGSRPAPSAIQPCAEAAHPAAAEAGPLAAERAAQAVCEQQYAEAAQAWRAMSERVHTDPRGARAEAQALTQALLDKMLGSQDLCIRLLTAGAGDRATAHALNVAVVSLLMGRAFEMPPSDLLELGLGAMLHDIGKLDLPARVHAADDAMSGADLALYRDHVAHGIRQGRRMGLAPAVLLVIGQHHEQADGSGFPQQLPLDRLSTASRIVALVNRYDNLCNAPVASKAMTPHEALSLLFAQGRQKFDATMLNGFVRMMGVYPPGSMVQLTDDRHAMVVACNSSRPLKPRVLVHDPAVPRDEALCVDLEAWPDLGIRRSLKPAQLPADALQYLAPSGHVAYFFEPVACQPEYRQELAA